MNGFNTYYRNDGEYPPLEEIEITRGVHRFEGVIQDYETEEPIQYLDFDRALEYEGELKRIHFNKLDVLTDGSFVAEFDLRDNSPIAAVIGGFIGFIIAGVVVDVGIIQAGKALEKSEDALKATAVNLQWIALIVISIGVFYTIGFKK